MFSVSVSHMAGHVATHQRHDGCFGTVLAPRLSSLLSQVSNRKMKALQPVMPSFSISSPIPVTIGDAEHIVVYGPYRSQRCTGPFPYKPTAGLELYNQNYQTFLASRSRIMNPLYAPKTSDGGNTRADYFSKQRISQKGTGTRMSQLLDILCGTTLNHAEPPEAYAELRELLDKHQVCSVCAALPCKTALLFDIQSIQLHCGHH